MQDYINGEKDPLTDPLIRSYYKDSLNLIKTIDFKMRRSPLLLNEKVVTDNPFHEIDVNNPRTWKYYKNLAGEYHETDTPMYVVSLDTKETILFSKDVLKDHPGTSKGYCYGSVYYQTLVSLFPDQEDLIKGILMPCDIEVAINAVDGTILRYDRNLVEDNEYTLIDELNDAVYRQFKRWYVDAFTVTDDYYLMAFCSQIYMFMLTKLFNIRDSKRNSIEVHSFFVKNGLRNYKELDKFYDILTREQSLYLYRNLPRLVKNVGLSSQFDELIERLLTVRNIRVEALDIVQKNRLDSTDNRIERMAVGIPLNQTNVSTEVTKLTIGELIEREKAVSSSNNDFYDSELKEEYSKIYAVDKHRLFSKDLIAVTQESFPIFSIEFVDFLLTHWAYGSHTGKYSGTVSFDNPVTGSRQSLGVKQAFAYFFYLSLAYVSEALVGDLVKNISDEEKAKIIKLNELLTVRKVTEFPEFLAYRHILIKRATRDDLLGLVDTSYHEKLGYLADYFSEQASEFRVATDPVAFYNNCTEWFYNYIIQHTNVDIKTDRVEKGYARNMVYRLYGDTIFPVGDGESVETFLVANSLLSREQIGDQIEDMISALFSASTGSYLRPSLDSKIVITSMIEIFKKLVSYNVQFVTVDSGNRITNLGFEPTDIHMRAHNEDGEGNNYLVSKHHLGMDIDFQEVKLTYIEDSN